MGASDFVPNIILALGGLGLFLYGMKLLIDGLENMAGSRMRNVIERATSNRFFGIGVGAAVTAIIQSSSATSLIAVGFVNAGLMSLAQAISVLMGSHVGTTITAHLFTFRLGDIAPLFIFFGLILNLFFKRKGLKDIGYISLSAGILFFGLSIMSGPLGEFAQTPGFQQMFLAFENPFLAILVGFLVTAVIQSSSAAMGILITLYFSGAEMEFTTIAYMLMGIAIGSTVTALIGSMAARRESKRMALANTIMVAIGTAVFGILIAVFPGILLWFQNTWYDGARQMAMLFTIFKASVVVMFLPFVGHLAALMYKIMPKRDRSTDEKGLHYIKTDNQSPSVIIDQTFSELQRMANMVSENYRLSLESLYENDPEKAETVAETEANINYLFRQITSLLGGIQNVESAADMKKISTLMYIAGDLERIGDHAENISEYDIRNSDNEMRLTPESLTELKTLSSVVIDMLNLMTMLFDSVTDELLQDVYHLERNIDYLAKKFAENHISRLKNEKIDPRGGVVFVNMLTNLERSGDHANNISYYFLETRQFRIEDAVQA